MAKQTRWGKQKTRRVHPQVDTLQPLKDVEVLATMLTIQNGGQQSGTTYAPKRAAAIRIQEALVAKGLPVDCCIKHDTSGIPLCPADAVCRKGYQHEKKHANKLPARDKTSPAPQGSRAGPLSTAAAGGPKVCKRAGCDRICSHKCDDGTLHPYCESVCGRGHQDEEHGIGTLPG